MFQRKVSNGLFCALMVSILFSSPSALASHNAGNDPHGMLLVPAGKFIYGTAGKTKNLKGFYIQKNEVTEAEAKKIIKDAILEKGKEHYPATEISYFDAEQYCKAIGARLPTMDEWEKAARGTDGRTYPWGNDFKDNAANTSETGKKGTVPVGSYALGKSPYGMNDMAGNVWEWVDAWDAAKRYRFVMGGSYFEGANNNTTTSSLKSIPDDVHPYVGFRCAKDQ